MKFQVEYAKFMKVEIEADSLEEAREKQNTIDDDYIEAERECRNYKRMTQGDRIRAMSDEELAEHFSELIKDTYENEYCKDVNDWLKWLQSEVEE